MKCLFSLLVSVGLLFATSVTTASESPLLKIDPVESSLFALVRKTGFLGFGTREHAIYAPRWFSFLRFNPENIKEANIEVMIPVPTIEVDTAEARKVAGLGPSKLSEKERQSFESTVKGPKGLDQEKFEQIRFTSEGLEQKAESSGDGGELWVKGNLTLRGVSKSIRFPVRWAPAENQTFRFSGTILIKQSEFGIEPFGKNEIEVRFVLRTKPETVFASL